jgi:hypothetical protein
MTEKQKAAANAIASAKVAVTHLQSSNSGIEKTAVRSAIDYLRKAVGYSEELLKERKP